MTDFTIEYKLEKAKYYLSMRKNNQEAEGLFLGLMRKTFDSITEAQDYFNKLCPPPTKKFDINESLPRNERLLQKAFIPLDVPTEDSDDELFYSLPNGCNVTVTYITEKNIWDPPFTVPPFEDDMFLNKFLNEIRFINKLEDWLNYLKARKENIEKEKKKLLETEELNKTFFEQQENYKEFLNASRIHSQVITSEADIGYKTKTGSSFRITNSKFLLSYNGELFSKDHILEKFGTGVRPGKFVEKIKEMCVCHEQTVYNKHTHIMIILKSRIDTKNENHFNIIYSFNNGKMQNFTPTVLIQTFPEQEKTKELFNKMDENVYRYVNTNQTSDVSTSSTSSVFSSIPKVDKEIVSHSMSNAVMISQKSTPNFSNKSDCSIQQQQNMSDSDDENESAGEINLQIFKKEYQNVLYREMINNIKLKTEDKTLCIFPSQDNSENDYNNLLCTCSSLNCLDIQKYFLLVLLTQQDEELFFNEIIESINENRWNKNTLFIYIENKDEDDNQNITEYIKIYNNIIKYIKKLRRGVISSKKYLKSSFIDLSLKIVVVFPKFLNKNDIKLYPDIEYRTISGDKFVTY